MQVLKVSEAIAILQENHQPDDVVAIDWLGKGDFPIHLALGDRRFLTEPEWSIMWANFKDYEPFDEILVDELQKSAVEIYSNRDAS